MTIGIAIGRDPRRGDACICISVLERKISARMQDRIGPNRVGPWGLLQPVADGIKILLEGGSDRRRTSTSFCIVIAPMISVFTTLLAFAVVPFGPVGQAPLVHAVHHRAEHRHRHRVHLRDHEPGRVWRDPRRLGVEQQVQHARFAAGECPGGELRNSARACRCWAWRCLAGTLNLEQILDAAGGGRHSGSWNFWYQPLACLIFFTSALAESNRLPFDLPECEQELVGGYHTEYGGLRFAMFFLGEYVHVVTMSFLMSILFFGGWHFPWIATPESAYAGAWLVKIGVLLGEGRGDDRLRSC